MGLDTSIYLKIKSKITKKEVFRVSVAYWRKYWGLTTTLLEVARRKEYWTPFSEAEIEGDWETNCEPDVIFAFNETITKLLFDYNADEWSQSLWGNDEARSYTAQQLSSLFIAESIIRDGIENLDYNFERFQILYNRENSYREDYPPLTEETFKNVIEKPRLYEYVIEFENSY